MNLPGKSSAIFVLFGVVLGVALSPWAAQRPQELVSNSVQVSYAQNKNTDDVKEPGNFSTIRKILSNFDKQQEELKVEKTLKVLGTMDTKNPINTRSGTVTIAVVGDSMVDTMGTNLPYLEKSLKRLYPNITFTLLNYGIGAQNAIKAVDRINSSYSYKDRNYPKITECGAQLILIDSFAYNPLTTSDEDLSNYKNALGSIIETARSSNAKVAIIATIAPMKRDFGKGPNGVNWDENTAWNHATKIQSYMEKSIEVASQHNVPIIDIYHATLQKNGEGVKQYVSTNDGIHPSESGHSYIAEFIANKIAILKLI